MSARMAPITVTIAPEAAMNSTTAMTRVTLANASGEDETK
jgi:hypothetical protein